MNTNWLAPVFKQNKLVVVVVAVVAVVVLIAIMEPENLGDDGNGDYEILIMKLNQVMSLDKGVGEKLAISRTGKLANYDTLVTDISEIEGLLSELSTLSATSEIAEDFSLQSDVADLVERFAAKKVKIERLKSAMAVVRNSMTFLPLAVFDLQDEISRQELSEQTSKEFRNLIQAANSIAYGDRLYWSQQLINSFEKLQQGKEEFSDNGLELIGKHLQLVESYQKQISEDIAEVYKLDFYGHSKQLLSVSIEQYRMRTESTLLVKNTLEYFALLLFLFCMFAFLRIRKQGEELRQDNLHSDRLNKALRKLAAFDHGNRDKDLYDVCVQSLAETCDQDIAAISFFTDDEKQELKTRSLWMDGKHQENIFYPIKGTPCNDVVSDGVCIVEDDVVRKYPDDEMLLDMGLRSYFGRRLVDREGEPIGLITLMSRSPVPESELITSLLTVFASRISIEFERSRDFAKTAQQREQALTTLNSIADGVVATDNTGKVAAINPAARSMLAMDEGDDGIGLSADKVFRIKSSVGAGELNCPVWDCLQTKQPIIYKEQIVIADRLGSELPVKLSAAPILSDDKEMLGVIVVFHDVSQERKFRAELAYQASHDALTGLLNRRALEAKFDDLFSAYQPGDEHALMYIDLDKFKVVNDTCGHSAGDELLKKLADLLSEQIREKDSIARLGGDEFFILLENCRLQKAQEVGEKILEQMSQFRFFWQGNEFAISASIGLMAINSDSYTYTELISMVDMACLNAKNSGRNKISVSEPGNVEYSQRKGEMLWVPRLRNALDEDWFELYQQPIVSAAKSSSLSYHEDGTDLSHVEILLRMRDPEGRQIMPYEFIGAAERYGMMTEVDRWVIRHVLARMAGEIAETSLKDAGFVSINLSGQSLADESLLGFVQKEMEHYGIDPARLCFEITETNVIANQVNATRLMETLKAQGCYFALDDFGSGLSSYAYIKNLPADFLKIDREFTRNLSVDKVNRAIVQSVIGVARSIGMQSIAEGVEDDQTCLALESYGVDYMQGYGLGMPEPVDEPQDYQIAFDQGETA